MISLNDRQLSILMQAARSLPPARRSQFLERCAAMLRLKGRFSDGNVAQIAELALTGLLQRADSAA